MTGKTHLAAGILASTTLITLLPAPTEPIHAILLTIGAAYGALLPDIDADYSIAKNNFFISSRIYCQLAKFFNRGGRKSCFVHRGIMHSLLIPSLYSIGFGFTKSLILKPLLLGIVVGLLSHLFLDLISSGEELLAPFTSKRFRLPLAFKTGGIMDHILRYASYTGVVCCLFGNELLSVVFSLTS